MEISAYSTVCTYRPSKAVHDWQYSCKAYGVNTKHYSTQSNYEIHAICCAHMLAPYVLQIFLLVVSND